MAIQIGTWLREHRRGASMTLFILGLGLLVVGALLAGPSDQGSGESASRLPGLIFRFAGVLMGLGFGIGLRLTTKQFSPGWAWAIAAAFAAAAIVTFIIPGYVSVPEGREAFYYSIGFSVLAASVARLWP